MSKPRSNRSSGQDTRIPPRARRLIPWASRTRLEPTAGTKQAAGYAVSTATSAPPVGTEPGGGGDAGYCPNCVGLPEGGNSSRP